MIKTYTKFKVTFGSSSEIITCAEPTSLLKLKSDLIRNNWNYRIAAHELKVLGVA